jgi:hypothetical protein
MHPVNQDLEPMDDPAGMVGIYLLTDLSHPMRLLSSKLTRTGEMLNDIIARYKM